MVISQCACGAWYSNGGYCISQKGGYTKRAWGSDRIRWSVGLAEEDMYLLENNLADLDTASGEEQTHWLLAGPFWWLIFQLIIPVPLVYGWESKRVCLPLRHTRSVLNLAREKAGDNLRLVNLSLLALRLELQTPTQISHSTDHLRYFCNLVRPNLTILAYLLQSLRA